MAANEVIVEEKYCYSCTSIKEYQYTWIHAIPGNTVFAVGRINAHSLAFLTGDNNEYKWNIEMIFGGCNEDSKDYVGVRIYSYSEEKIKNHPNFQAMAKLSIIDKNNKQRMGQTAILTKQNYNDIQFQKFVKRDDLLSSTDLLSNNELKLMCQISFHTRANPALHSIRSLSVLKCRDEQMSNFEKMFEIPEFSDFQFVIGDTRIKVHKCILAAHSNVFAAMFQNDMIEKSKNEVDIEDIDADVMKQLLRFVYVGEVGDIHDFADKLFIAADKYELNGLKDLCEEKLIKKLYIDNLYETLQFVDEYDTIKVKEAAIKFIIHNSKNLSAMKEFKKSIKNLSSSLLAEVICAFMAKPFYNVLDSDFRLTQQERKRF